MAFVAIGPTDIIAEALCGPRQHDQHTKGWRYHRYMQDQAKLEARLRAELRAMIAVRERNLNPRVADNDAGEITVTLNGCELRGWSYEDDAERRTKMVAAREYVEGYCDGRAAQ